MKTSASAWTDGYGLYWAPSSSGLRFFVNNYSLNFVEAPVATGGVVEEECMARRDAPRMAEIRPEL